MGTGGGARRSRCSLTPRTRRTEATRREETRKRIPRFSKASRPAGTGLGNELDSTGSAVTLFSHPQVLEEELRQLMENFQAPHWLHLLMVLALSGRSMEGLHTGKSSGLQEGERGQSQEGQRGGGDLPRNVTNPK